MRSTRYRTRQSFLVQMVEDRNDLSNAMIAINSSMSDGARLIGPSSGGFDDSSGGRGLVLPDWWR